MKREVMEAADLSIYAEIGLILFVLGFVFVLIRVLLYKKEEVEHLEQLPLDGDAESGA
ncbi:hypothetical protein [Persicimonas caeni]|uniref:hypothetical protein n=1 Tax=Persicimonas caeni TaxID=2292766 RepID=UPI00143CCD3F|nr:hypothetical protein [Persicimonas caeni]